MKIGVEQRVYFGPPGCGKTTTLLNLMQDALDRGVGSRRIAFVSFTRKAVAEARNRAVARFALQAEDLPYFATIHSLCYRTLPIDRSALMDDIDLARLTNIVGYPLTIKADEETHAGVRYGGDKGDALLFMSNLARIKRVSLEQVYADHPHPRLHFEFSELDRFDRVYRAFKDHEALEDYTDLLEMYVEQGWPVDVDLALIDEAQDLSPLQWLVLKRAFGKTKLVCVAGDDDQAIHTWAGAMPESMLALEGERIILSQSHRVPIAVQAVATSIITRVQNRVDKTWAPRPHPGAVVKQFLINGVDLDDREDTWYLLCRNNYIVRRWYMEFRRMGIYFDTTSSQSISKNYSLAYRTFARMKRGLPIVGKHMKVMMRYAADLTLPREPEHDRTYYSEEYMSAVCNWDWFDALTEIPLETRIYMRLVVARYGDDYMDRGPRVYLGSIHSVKGGEADNVILFTDRSQLSHMSNPDDEHRVYYVGVTRARKRLYVARGSGVNAYQPLWAA